MKNTFHKFILETALAGAVCFTGCAPSLDYKPKPSGVWYFGNKTIYREPMTGAMIMEKGGNPEAKNPIHSRNYDAPNQTVDLTPIIGYSLEKSNLIK